MGKNETKRRNQHTRDREERMPKKQKTKEHVESAQRKLQNLLGSGFILFLLESRNDYNIGKSPT